VDELVFRAASERADSNSLSFNARRACGAALGNNDYHFEASFLAAADSMLLAFNSKLG
jgi:hypothetical protein